MKDIDELKEMLHTLRVCDENSFIELGEENPNSRQATHRVRLIATPGGLKYAIKQLRFMGYANVEGGGIYFENDDQGINQLIETMIIRRDKGIEIGPLMRRVLSRERLDQMQKQRNDLDWFLHFNTDPNDVGVGAVIKQRIADAQAKTE